MPVPEKSCEVPDCDYKTPDGLPSYEARRRELGLHLAMAHPEAARLWAEVHGQAGPAAPARQGGARAAVPASRAGGSRGLFPWGSPARQKSEAQ